MVQRALFPRQSKINNQQLKKRRLIRLFFDQPIYVFIDVVRENFFGLSAQFSYKKRTDLFSPIFRLPTVILISVHIFLVLM